ncbi:MAG: malectin domain-containing carbohydrate-binding protein, partial [Micrococcales bacterium]|nr:malectin domain-containing carbohydrate-binding protein [Micrococcales bacterium]
MTDSRGRVWAARGTGFGGWKRSSQLAGQPIARTVDDVLYQRVGYGMKFYRLDVPAAATYRVRLLFTEPTWTRAGQRVFDVRAEGALIAKNVDIAKAVGKAAAYDITVPVRVTDGRLDLQFVAKTDTAALAAVEVTSSTPVAPAAARRFSPLVPVANSSFYYQDISRAPLALNSPQAAANLAAQVRNHWGGVAALNTHTYNASVAYSTSKTPRVRVGFHNCQRKGYLPDGLFNGPGHFLDVPIPTRAVPASGRDGQLTVYDKASDTAWEFWQMRKGGDGRWSACWGGRIDKVSKNPGIFPKPFGVSASGLLMAPGVISVDDFTRGRIDHAMYLAIIAPSTWSQVSWPANRSDGYSRDPHALAEGQRLRLDPSLDIGQLGLTPVGDMVARAAQKHGFVVSDTAGAVSVVTESGAAVQAATRRNPWNDLLAGP